MNKKIQSYCFNTTRRPGVKGGLKRCCRLGMFLGILFLVCSCSTTRKLTEGEVLYTGVKKMEVKLPDKYKLPGSQKSALTSPLSYPPNNPLYSPYIRTPFPLGLWVYNWNIKKEKGFKWWLYRKLSKKPVLISKVQPELRLKMVDNTMKNFGFFGVESHFDTIPNRRNPKKAKISYFVKLPEPFRYGTIQFSGWNHSMDSIVKTAMTRTELKAGEQYDINILNSERENMAKQLRNSGYFYFQPDYIEFLADTTRESKVVDIRIAVKQGVPDRAFHPYSVNSVTVDVTGGAIQAEKDTISYDSLSIISFRPARLKPRVLGRAVKVRPGQLYSANRQNKTQVDFVQLGVFKYATLNITPTDTSENPVARALNFRINADYALPIETEIELDVASKSNNLLGPGLTFGISNKNLFKRGENLSFKFNGAYEWQIGSGKNKEMNSSGLINSYELGLNINLSVPRLLIPRFMQTTRDRQERTHFQLGVDFLNRHSFFRMISFSGSASYDFNSSRRNYHTVVPFKLNYTYLLRTSKAFDEALDKNPAIALSFKNQFIPSMSYTYTYDRMPSYRNPNRLFWQTGLTQAGNIISGIFNLTGDRHNPDKTIFGNRYSQFLKLTSEIIGYERVTETSLLAMRFMGGIGYAYGNSSVMPYSEQFYIGGANSIRAFQIRSIGPGSYHPVGKGTLAYLDQTGDIKLEANIEYRFKIYGRFHGALFVDAGNVWLLRGEAERPGGEFKLQGLLNEIGLGTGFGLRYDIDFIVLRADLGIGIHTPYKNPEKSGYYNISSFKNAWALNIAIGYPF